MKPIDFESVIFCRPDNYKKLFQDFDDYGHRTRLEENRKRHFKFPPTIEVHQISNHDYDELDYVSIRDKIRGVVPIVDLNKKYEDEGQVASHINMYLGEINQKVVNMTNKLKETLDKIENL